VAEKSEKIRYLRRKCRLEGAARKERSIGRRRIFGVKIVNAGTCVDDVAMKIVIAGTCDGKVDN
jgi:hypothetical protein